ncbi:type VII secretion protein EccCa [Tumebacillus sp. DT12]|uniref:Type VII secretion protein EccCa n=1 Tax=Tumebacillus lacus TaxID=2995335 RepID=A0ABT3X7Z0_9BACL|nr:type VII secretion protein EccCa [Tumebacillus lacus]MCX7572112.1 type VII secretion protein EccCa [Tumebacillus lacus]
MNGIQYYRPARTYPDPLPKGEIKVVAPPPLQPPNKGMLFMAIVMALLTSCGALAGVFVFNNPTMAIMAGVMAAVSITGAIIQSIHQSQNRMSQQRSVKKKYIQYLDQQNDKLEQVVAHQMRYYSTLFPQPQEMVSLVEQRERIWERNRSDEDFLTVAMGRGSVPLSSKPKLEMDENPFTEYDKNLIYRGQSLVQKFEKVNGAPVELNLKNINSLAIRGKRHMTQEMVRAILSQVAVFHAPEDVQMLAYFSKEVENQWQWFKWLPHARRPRSKKGSSKGKSLCYMANNPNDFIQMFNEQVLPRLMQAKKAREEKKPNPMLAEAHQFLILDGIDLNSLVSQSSAMAELFESASEAGITVISLVDGRYGIPSTFNARIHIGEEGEFMFEEVAFGGRRAEGAEADRMDLKTSERIARGLAPLIQSEKAESISLADMIKMTEVMGLKSADRVDPATSWQPKPREAVLRAPIGVRVDGQPVIVDLKEAADGGMGPHGLIIGATGSGKSETLRTLVTGLAINNDAEMINFIFVDFKGGAGFAELATLPHCAGMITNLEGESGMIDRFYDSLMGEMERRQKALRDGGNLDNIKQYQVKRQSSPYMKPLPYLVLIIDEFGELLAARPDFIDLFNKIGRIGRSIGIHLLFATQRLEEGRLKGLEGHLRYRMCLRTFSEQESRTVIGTPDAFYLPSYPGVGYFKVDTHIYDLFKTASVSSPYVPAGAEEETGLEIAEFNASGQIVDFGHGYAEAAATKEASSQAKRTDMEVMIGHLNDYVKYVEQDVHQVWLPPLERNMPLSKVFQSPEFLQTLFNSGNYPYFNGSDWPTRPVGKLLKVPVGVLDIPMQQRQEPLLLDFLGNEGHLMVVGAPQTGKSTILRTIIASFMMTHKPSDVQFYAVDLGGGLLRGLEGAPHIGTVYGKGDREKFPMLIRQVHGLIEERERYFREKGIDTMATYRERRANGELPDAVYGDVFLIIDDIAQLQTDFFELVDGEVTELVTAGLNYGIHVILTANRWADIRIKLRDNITGRLELRLNDPSDSDVGRNLALSLPKDIEGRGLIREGLQFQAALPRMEGYGVDSEEPLQKAIDAMVQVTRDAWKEQPAPPIRILPFLVRKGDVQPQQLQMAGVPLGLEDSRLDVIGIDLIKGDPHFLLYGDSESGKTNFLRVLMKGLMERYTPEQVQFIVVDYRRTMYDFLYQPEHQPYLKTYAWNSNMVNDAVMNLRFELDPRISSAELSPTLKATWEGPQYFMICDDFDMVASQMGNPISMLQDYLLQAKDIGFHTILARRVGGTSRSFDQFVSRMKEMSTPGIIMNGDSGEGPILGNQRAELLPPGRGYLVRRNQKNRMVQLFFDEQPQTEE